jgi:hypothetical protein
VSAQDVATAISAVFIVGMIWLRTRMHYAQRRAGALRLARAGRVYFAAALAALAVGWLAAPLLARTVWPVSGASATLVRVIWFLGTYYVFIVVHRALQSQHIDVFTSAEPL